MPSLQRAVAALACIVLVSGLGVGVAAPVSATSTLLCTGYGGCNALGMSNAGYRASSGTMWWRMYAGHNCTNYVAYRMAKSGLPNVRPWSGGGNASNWGGKNASLTNSVPAVGAVAWWDANVRPAGSSGHVAYVEQVLSANKIIVSQDSWGGDFSWARITRVGGSWPSGFIHFNDVPLNNTARPTVSGTPKVGAVLTASPGTWTPSDPRYAYQWHANGVAIAGANGSSLTLKLAQEGKRISVRLTAAKLGYPTTTASSTSTSAVAPGLISNTDQPTISGDPKVDSTLTASPGQWKPTPTAFAYQWSADQAPIPGAITSTLTPSPELVGKAISVTVTASKAGYRDVSAASEGTARVAPGTFTVTVPATVNGNPRLGETLRFHPGGFTPVAAEVSVQWTRARVRLGPAGSTYQLTADDLGSRIAAVMTLRRPGYTTLTMRTMATRPVKSVPVLRVLATPRKGRVRVAVTVTADGVTRVPGTVRIRSRGKVITELTLRNGAAAITLAGLPSGTRTFRMRYLGSKTVIATTVIRTVRIG